jgi:hypothetical protein
MYGQAVRVDVRVVDAQGEGVKGIVVVVGSGRGSDMVVSVF